MVSGINFSSNEFIALCKSHKVSELYAFGSVVNGNFNENSDVDLLIEIDEPDPVERGSLILSFWNKSESYFNRRVDLLTISSLRNPYLKASIDQTKILIYDGSKEEVL
jgi:predicted nucleotidyltransferase